jgi:hypothetical protein
VFLPQHSGRASLLPPLLAANMSLVLRERGDLAARKNAVSSPHRRIFPEMNAR